MFDAAAQYVYGGRGRLRHQRKGRLSSDGGKSSAAGTRWRDGRVIWSGLTLIPVFDLKDTHCLEAHAQFCRVKYLRLIKRIIGGKTRWPVQLNLAGAP